MKRNPFIRRRIILIILLCLMPISILAQKVNPDTLNLDELNLYKEKAVTMRNTGRIVTLVGLGVTVTGAVFGIYALSGDIYAAGIAAICGVAGLATTIVGVPLWAVGGSRKAKAEVAVQKFNIAPEGSMAVGLGITIRF
jgi:hypothetical protein